MHIVHSAGRVKLKGLVVAALLALLPATVQADAITDESSLTGYWRLNESAGSATVSDSSGNGFTGNVSSSGVTLGAPPPMPQLGSAALFDGSTGKIDVAHDPALNNATYTIETWARVDGGSGSFRSPLTSRANSPDRGYIFYAANNDTWQFWNGNGSAGGLWPTISGPSVVEGQWVHLAGTYDNATNTKRFYLNGAQVGEQTAAHEPNPDNPLRMGAGASESSGQYFFDGPVDNTAVFDDALGAERLQAHYNEFSGYAEVVSSDGAVGHWRLGEQSGTTAVDAIASRDGEYLNGVSVRQFDTALRNDVDTAASFDGNNDKLDIPFDPALNPESFSVEVWAKPTGGAGSFRSPVTSRDDQVDADGLRQEGYILYAANNDTWQFWTGTGSGWDSLQGDPVEMGEWTHLVATFESLSEDADGIQTGTKKLFIDGELAATTDSAQYLPNDEQLLRIGAGASELDGQFFFPGLLDEVSIYDHALTAGQAEDHFRVGRSIPEPATMLIVAVGGLGLLPRRRRTTSRTHDPV